MKTVQIILKGGQFISLNVESINWTRNYDKVESIHWSYPKDNKEPELKFLDPTDITAIFMKESEIGN